MKKLLAPLVLLLIAAMLVTSCEKGDMKIKKLNHGDGRWTITSIRYQYYDSLGANVVFDSTASKPGEIVVFTTTTLNGLFNYRLCVANMNESTGVSVYPCEIFFDESRVHFGSTVDGDPPGALAGLWTVDDSSRRKQEWSTYSLRADGTLALKRTANLKFDKR
jgi:hypothetical protein